MLIDHLIYAAPDLETAVAELEQRFGVRAGGGGSHPGRGTHNTVLALGARTYLEVIAPDPGQPEPAAPRPYGVDAVTRGGLVGWALACEDLDTALIASRATGFDPGDVTEGERLTPTGTVLRWRLPRNALAAGPIPFLISWGETPHPATSAPSGLTLESLRLEHPDPAVLQGPLDALDADVEVHRAPDVALVARLHGPHGSDELR